MTSGVYERKRKPCSEEIKKKMSEIFKGRKIVNGHWAERGENKTSLNKSIEFLESLKGRKNIDVRVKSLDEALLLGLKELEKKLYKPIRKVWVMAIKSMHEEEIEQYEEMLNEMMNRGKTIFPEAILTISELKEKA